MDLTGGLKIARIRGIAILVHWSWALIFSFLSWILSQTFREEFGWSDERAWAVGIAAALGFFLSVLLHEISHALVAQRYGMNVPSITLFIFGGVSAIAAEMRSARQEFFIAAAGPAMSFLLAVVLIAVSLFLSGAAQSIVFYLGAVNGVLGIFNLLPGFPLDGGRVFRSIVWARTGDLTKATNVASNTGVAIAWVMMGGGVLLTLLTGSFSGLWYVFIGLFLKQAAEAARAQHQLERALRDVTVADLMHPSPEPLPETSSLQRVVDERVLARGQRCVLLEQDGRVTGLLTTTDLSKTPREEWPTTSARTAMVPTDQIATIAPGTPATEALRVLAERDIHQLPVIDEGRLVGMLSRGDVLNYIQTRMQFADFGEVARRPAGRPDPGPPRSGT